ncbi:TlpA family protein disulfide reductase [Actomonas aquatica]|uniref:TlpA disulfide reductase family protein n=1 Tax=Actomonas aquatica TaxID=2866162 RepID=A0ABZ1CEE8_9BACT|nr:TlpA disulfide reductase family protein [Opitutus sp. WL0086]WRQ89821.1 TlpA disulfide reductase family protein [Opitutus sp. WL0086]
MKKYALVLTLGLSLTLVAACSGDGGTTESASAATADVAALPDLGTAPSWTLAKLDGTKLSSADLKGKVVVVDFWATWCPPCREEIPGYVEMQRELEAQGVVIVGVSLDRAGVPVVQKFAQDYEINYPIVMGDQDLTETFGGIEAIPTTFLIDRDGKIRHRKVGSMSREDYEPLVRSLL